MQEIWANMLANAADERKLVTVRPTFPIILKELGTCEVRLLDRIYAENHSSRFIKSYTMTDLMKVFEAVTEGFDDEDPDLQGVEYSVDILRRHNLLTQSLSTRTIDRFDAVKNPSPEVEIALDESFELSTLGSMFVQACKAPRHKQQETS